MCPGIVPYLKLKHDCRRKVTRGLVAAGGDGGENANRTILGRTPYDLLRDCNAKGGN
jgi:hypothetical protein